MKKTLLLFVLALLGAGLLVLRQHVVNEVELFAVQTGSMGTSAPIGSIVATRAADHVAPGDVITYERANGQVITHRVQEVQPDGLLVTQGDTNELPDPWRVELSEVRGVVSQVVPNAGYLLTFLTLPAGLASLLCGLLTIYLAWRLFFAGDEQAPVVAPAGA